MKITAIILTLNEEMHLARCISSIHSVCDEIVVVDAFSIDSTIEIAKKYHCTILQNKWVNHGNQFNWALLQLKPETDWILRIDADEYLDVQLHDAIKAFKKNPHKSISGALFRRVIRFQGRDIRFGGVSRVRIMRLFQYSKGMSETRWMDEHIIVNGQSETLPGALIDDNLRSLGYWIEKHNRYADREAFECLALKYQNQSEHLHLSAQETFSLHWTSGLKRKIKNQLYQKLPLGFRAFAYFICRYLFFLGFLDGSKGFAFHFLQGYWYRYLVDLKLKEVEGYMQLENVSYLIAAKKILHIDGEA